MRHWPAPPAPPTPPSAEVVQVLIAAHHAARDAELALPLLLVFLATVALCCVLFLMSWAFLAARSERFKEQIELEMRRKQLLANERERESDNLRVSRRW